MNSRISQTVFANEKGKQYLTTSINHLHRDVAASVVDGKRRPIFGADFVLHSPRNTMLTRLGESGVDAFTTMHIAGPSSIVVSQRYVHPTPEALERAFERLQLHGDGGKQDVPTIFPAVGKGVSVSH